MAHIVTISATYGAGGSIIGPAAARELGVPFLDRAIPNTVAQDIGCSLDDALEHDDRAPTGLERLLASAARLPSVTLGSIDTTFIGATDAEGRLLYDQEFVDHTERVIREVAESGGVILGRAAAVVLAEHPRAVHVRLDGPKTRRLSQAVAMREQEAMERLADIAERPAPGDIGDTGATPAGGTGEDAGPPEWAPPTMRELEDNDRARAAYVRRFYRVDSAQPRFYHLVIDSTVVSIPTCVDVITRVARERMSDA